MQTTFSTQPSVADLASRSILTANLASSSASAASAPLTGATEFAYSPASERPPRTSLLMARAIPIAPSTSTLANSTPVPAIPISTPPVGLTMAEYRERALERLDVEMLSEGFTRIGQEKVRRDMVKFCHAHWASEARKEAAKRMVLEERLDSEAPRHKDKHHNAVHDVEDKENFDVNSQFMGSKSNPILIEPSLELELPAPHTFDLNPEGIPRQRVPPLKAKAIEGRNPEPELPAWARPAIHPLQQFGLMGKPRTIEGLALPPTPLPTISRGTTPLPLLTTDEEEVEEEQIMTSQYVSVSITRQELFSKILIAIDPECVGTVFGGTQSP